MDNHTSLVSSAKLFGLYSENKRKLTKSFKFSDFINFQIYELFIIEMLKKQKTVKREKLLIILHSEKINF